MVKVRVCEGESTKSFTVSEVSHALFQLPTVQVMLYLQWAGLSDERA